MIKLNKSILIFVVIAIILTFILVVINHFSKPLMPLPPVVDTTGTSSEEPSLIFGLITRDDRIKHVEWTYRNGKSYEQVSLVAGGPKNYVVTFYQPNFREDANDGGGIMVFQIKDSQPNLIWESKEVITLTMPEVLDVRDITGDKKVEIISQWSDEKLSFLYLYSWNGNTFNFITPLRKVESKYAPPNLYSLVFGVYKGDIYAKDIDADNIDEIIISSSIMRDNNGDEVSAESETIYKWDTQKQEYYLWKTEKVGDGIP